MGFFQSQLVKVIEWTDNSRDVLVFRFPMDGREIMTGSTLVVRESQVAVFVKDGEIADIFAPGRYKLETKNIPLLTKICSLLRQDAKSKFTAEVYYINTNQFTNQKWGTTNPITMRDNDFGMIRIRGYGVFSFRVGDAKVFLNTLFGTKSSFRVEDINNYLKSILVSGVSDAIAESNVSALDMASNLNEFGAICTNSIQGKFADLGLTLATFVVENISFPENVEKAIDERTTLGILGGHMGTYTQKKAADAMGDAAKNPGMAGTFMGIGVGQAMSGAVTGAFNGSKDVGDREEGKQRFCLECGAKMGAKAKFCPECGAKQASSAVCSNCGTALKAGAKFCPECGKKVE